MKNKEKKNNDLFVYNLALRRDDGKIEQDTVFRDKLFTRDEVEQIAKKYICSILVSCVGMFKQGSKSFIDDNSFFVELPKPVEVENAKE